MKKGDEDSDKRFSARNFRLRAGFSDKQSCWYTKANIQPLLLSGPSSGLDQCIRAWNRPSFDYLLVLISHL